MAVMTATARSISSLRAGGRTTGHAERGAGLARVLRGNDVRILFYTFGGNQPRGTVFASPYREEQRSMTILREAITGPLTDGVDLRTDRLCCTNRLKVELPLSPDTLIPRAV